MSALLSMLAGWKGYAIAGGLAFVLGFGSCWHLRNLMDDHRKLKEVRRVIVYREKQAAVTAKVSEKAEAQQVQIRTVTRTIIQKVPTYVTREADARCTVPRGFVRLHDAAAQGVPVPEPAGQSNDAPSGIGLSAVAGTVADNYGACHENAARLSALQEWVREQQAIR